MIAETKVTLPTWKAEILERKRKKAKTDDIDVEVPQWKRDLLKRIHSKSQRMSAEQQEQADILEEHISKVSDNFFLVHEKKQHRLPSAALPKASSHEVPPAVALSVGSVIIIEKDSKDAANESSLTSSSDSVFGTNAEDKEYPSVGIVHRLMGRFQAEKSASLCVEKTQRAQNPAKPTARAMTLPPPTSHATPTEGNPPPNHASSGSHPRMYSSQSDLLSPLLMSSAKPFSRQIVQSAADHWYHHVSVPVRKATTPTSPKYAAPTRFELAAVKMDPDPPRSSFNKDLSSLHGNREPPTSIAIKETFVIQPKAVIVPKRVNLTNGGTLHSSGSEPQHSPPILAKEQKKTPQLRDKSNFSTYDHSAAVQEPKRPEWKELKTRFESPKKETVVIPKQLVADPKIWSLRMKENREDYGPVSKRHDKSENQFKQVVRESFDESTLKSQAAVAANRIMKTSKTFKITPSGQAQKSNSPVSNVAATNALRSDSPPAFHKIQTANSIPFPASQATPNGFARQPTSPVPLLRHETSKEAEEKVSQSVQKASPTTRTWPPIKPPSDIPSTSIDDIVDSPDSVAIGPVSSFTVAPKEVRIAQQQVPTVIHTPVFSPEPPKEMKPLDSFVVGTSSNSTRAVTPKSEPAQKHSLPFPPKVAKSSTFASCGSSFTIDPSKFRRSSAQPPSASAAYSPSSATTQEVSGTRTVVPSFKGSISTETDFDTPKTGKRKLTVDQITVIGGYISLEKSCLAKKDGRKKSVTLSFSENGLNKTYTYASERSLLEEQNPTVESSKLPGFAKDSTIGKYTPKYLLSMKATDFPDDEENENESKSPSSPSLTQGGMKSSTNNANAVPDDTAAAWSNSGSADMLF